MQVRRQHPLTYFRCSNRLVFSLFLVKHIEMRGSGCSSQSPCFSRMGKWNCKTRRQELTCQGIIVFVPFCIASSTSFSDNVCCEVGKYNGKCIFYHLFVGHSTLFMYEGALTLVTNDLLILVLILLRLYGFAQLSWGILSPDTRFVTELLGGITLYASILNLQAICYICP